MKLSLKPEMLLLPFDFRIISAPYTLSSMSLNSSPATPNTIPNQVQSPPLPIEVDKDIEYEISEILDSKLNKQRQCQLLYLIQWAGYEGTDQETDWLPATELKHATELVQDLHDSYPNKPRPLNLL